MLKDWHAMAAHLASYLVPGQLELALVCDLQPGDVNTAEFVLDSLRLLPVLKDCHVRLCGATESQLQKLTQEAALQARRIASLTPFGSPSPEGCSTPRLINLPLELRLRILIH